MTDQRTKELTKVTWVGFAVNLVLTIAKTIAGFIGHSHAMVADAMHSLTDIITDVIVLVFIHISGKERDKDHDYGHGKYETIASLAVSLLLVVVAVKFIMSGITKIKLILAGDAAQTPGMIALWAAVISIVSKELLYQYTYRVGKKAKSPALIANAWHHRSDAFSSIASLVGIGAAIFLGGKWAILDPLTGCVIGAVIIYLGIKMALPALNELSEASLSDAEKAEITSLAMSVEGVIDLHNLQTRRSGPNVIIDAHVVVDGKISVIEGHAICDRVEKVIMDNFGSQTQISLHTEPLGVHDIQ